MNKKGKALIGFIDNNEKWLDFHVPQDLTGQVVLKIKLFRRWKSLFIGILKYATAETILVLLLKSLAM